MKCQIDGCSRQASDKHHKVYRSNGGDDSPQNILHYCKQHHTEWHSTRGDFRLWGSKGGCKTQITKKTFLSNLKQFKNNPQRQRAWLERYAPEALDSFPVGG